MIDTDAPLGEDERKEMMAKGSAKPWLDMLVQAENTFQTWQDKCDNIDKLYSNLERQADMHRDRQFAMFWANIQVLGPAIYSRPPKPVVVPRFNDRRPVPTKASEMLERDVDVAFEMDDIDYTMRLVRDDLNLSARGVPWVRYEVQDGRKKICIEHKFRTDFLHETARNWKEVGWVAGAAYLTKDEMRKRFKSTSGEEYLDATYEVRRDARNNGAADDQEKAKVWEIWSKTENKVVWVSEGIESVLDEDKPHLKLEGFFPCPRPAYATTERGSLIPVPDVTYYRDQLEEINEMTARIGALADAVRVRGFYPAGTGEIGDAIEAAINTVDNGKILVPISNFAAFGNGSAKDTIVWMPIDMIVQTIVALVELRKQMIDDVYEITGLSDIMRGNTAASETATAQKLKSQYGSMRVRDKQAEMVRVARDIARIAGEIMAENFDGDTLLDMAQMDIPTDAQMQKVIKGLEDQARQLITQVEQAQQSPEAQQMAQENPEQAKQMMQQAQGQLQQIKKQIEDARETPTIDQIMKLLRDQKIRPFALDIETDSTIQPDEDAEKQRRAEFLQALGGMLGQLAPMIQGMPQSAPFAGELLKFAIAPFRAGRELDGAVDDFIQQVMSAPAPADPNEATAKADAQAAAEEMKLKMAELQANSQADERKAQLEAQKMQSEAQIKMAELNLKREEAGAKIEADRWTAQL